MIALRTISESLNTIATPEEGAHTVPLASMVPNTAVPEDESCNVMVKESRKTPGVGVSPVKNPKLKVSSDPAAPSKPSVCWLVTSGVSPPVCKTIKFKVPCACEEIAANKNAQ